MSATSTATVTLSVNTAALGAGTYTGTVTINGGDYAAPETLWVTLTLNRVPLVITAIARSGDDISLGWSTLGGTTNVVQLATGNALGSSNAFTDLSGNIIIPGSGIVTNSFTDAGGATNALPRFYRVRMAP